LRTATWVTTIPTMLITLVPLLVLILGLCCYSIPQDPKYAKLMECGRIAYFVGLLVLVWHLASKTIRLG
jgi:hypothetical protein